MLGCSTVSPTGSVPCCHSTHLHSHYQALHCYLHWPDKLCSKMSMMNGILNQSFGARRVYPLPLCGRPLVIDRLCWNLQQRSDKAGRAFLGNALEGSLLCSWSQVDDSWIHVFLESLVSGCNDLPAKYAEIQHCDKIPQLQKNQLGYNPILRWLLIDIAQLRF